MPSQKPVNVLGEEFDVTFKNVGLDRHKRGSIALPETMSLSEAAFWIDQRIQEEEKIVSIDEPLYGFPFDCANALQLAVEEIYGVKQMQKTPGDWFSPGQPPAFTNLPINPEGDTISVFIGRFSIPGYQGGFIETYPKGFDSLMVHTECKSKCLPQFNNLMTVARRKLRDDSIYRGKAFEIQSETLVIRGNKVVMHKPSFIDVRKMPTNLLLNEDTDAMIRHGIWVPIERTEQVRHYNNGIVRRGALLHGKPGTGKTLTAQQTAKIAQQNGWTFLLVKDSKMVAQVYSLALRYAPVVLFAEDIDHIVDDYTQVSTLNNILDGVGSKSQDIITVLTTNFVEKLPPTLLRPGRFDVVARYTAPNAKTAAALVRMYLSGQIDDTDFDDAKIGKELEGNVPAVLHEVAKRATTNALTRYENDYRGSLKIATQDVMLASWTMKEHARLLRNEQPEPEDSLTKLGRGIGRGLRDLATGAIKDESGDISDALIGAIDQIA